MQEGAAWDEGQEELSGMRHHPPASGVGVGIVEEGTGVMEPQGWHAFQERIELEGEDMGHRTRQVHRVLGVDPGR